MVLSKDEQMDNLQIELAERYEKVECPLKHVFLKGVYIRQIFMPAVTINSQGEAKGTVIMSKVHGTTHPYIVTEGEAAVYNKADEFLGIITAPYIAMTIPGTRRILQIMEDCYWLTVHILPYITGEENGWSDKKKSKLLERIEKDIIESKDMKLTGNEVVR